MDKLLNCPFCGGDVDYHCDDMGGEWVEHKIKHVDGKKDPCILTTGSTDFSAEFGMTWNTRAVKRLSEEEVAKVISEHGNKNRSFLYDGCNIVAKAICELQKENK